MYVNSSSYQLSLLACTPLFPSLGSPRRPPASRQRWTKVKPWPAPGGQRRAWTYHQVQGILWPCVNGPSLLMGQDSGKPVTPSALSFSLWSRKVSAWDSAERFCFKCTWGVFLFLSLDFRVASADLGAQCIWILHPLSTIQMPVFLAAFFVCPLCAAVCGGFYGACDSGLYSFGSSRICALLSFVVGGDLYFRISVFLFLCVFVNVCLCDSLSLSLFMSLRETFPFGHCGAFFDTPFPTLYGTVG